MRIYHYINTGDKFVIRSRDGLQQEQSVLELDDESLAHSMVQVLNAEVYHAYYTARDDCIWDIQRIIASLFGIDDPRSIAIAATLKAIKDRFDAYLPDHQCKCIAKIEPIGHGRHIWIGVLQKPIEGYPSETHCLHVTTPQKSVVFGLNAGDGAVLAVIGQIIHGRPVNQHWVELTEKAYRSHGG